MDAERFEHLAAAYGGDPRRWPEAERAQALAFLDADPAAERILFEARQIDAALDASAPMPVSHVLRDAILAAAPQAQPERDPEHESVFDWRRWLAPALGLVCASVIGVYAGATVMQRVTAGPAADALVAEASAPAVDELEILG